MNTYPEMNEKIVGLLELSDEPMHLYAAQRIKELEQQVAKHPVPDEAGKVKAEEIWDEFSEYMNDDLDSCQTFAGTTIMTKSSFMKAISKFNLPAPPSGEDAGKGWLKREEHPDGFIDGELFHFLVHVVNNQTNREYWDIITGYVDNSGSLISQCNDEDSGWVLTDAIYFKHINDLPPLK